MKIILDADGSTDLVAITLMHKALISYYGNIRVEIESKENNDRTVHSIVTFEKEELL